MGGVADKSMGTAVEGGADGIVQRREYYQQPPLLTSHLPISEGGGVGAEGKLGVGQHGNQVFRLGNNGDGGGGGSGKGMVGGRG